MLSSQSYVIAETVIVGSMLLALVYKLSKSDADKKSEPKNEPLAPEYKGPTMLEIDMLPTYTRRLASDVINGGVRQYGIAARAQAHENDEPLVVDLEQQPPWEAYTQQSNEYIGRWPARGDHKAAHSIQPQRHLLQTVPGTRAHAYWDRLVRNIE